MRFPSLGFAILLGLTSLAIAQTAVGEKSTKKKMMMTGHRYDAATVVTVQGTIDEVKFEDMMPGMSKSMMRGVHLILKAGAGTVEVHLGPEKYLTDNKITFTKGDVITVIGSKLKIDGADALIAREVKKGADVFTFRDEAGVPKWAGQMGGMGMMKGKEVVNGKKMMKGKGMMKDKEDISSEKQPGEHQH